MWSPKIVTRKRIRAVTRAYMRIWHGMEVVGSEYLPPRGPALLLGNHASNLDVPAWLAIDPYPETTILALASLFRWPIIRQVLIASGAIPVRRGGRDTGSVQRVLRALQEGRVVVASVESTRSLSGRLGEVHPVLAGIAVRTGTSVVPMAIAGSFEALPRYALLPRRRKIVVRIGPPLSFAPGTKRADAADRIRDAVAALLPPEQQPAPDAATVN
jgi:1-acyl-sn-glycerol-3-phosphate acyltransferase